MLKTMKLQGIISRLEKHHKKKIDLTLGRTFNLLKKLGNPQDKLENIVNVVGTNSKASMAHSLNSILNEAGYRCNLYTSPHLQSYTERFIFNDQKIEENDLIDLLIYIEKILGEDQATLFEILTCAFYKFAENFKDNINIIESGLFYSQDPSSVFKKNLMTLLGVCHIDHLQWLKNKTIDGIIHEKTSKLLVSNIFINKQHSEDIRLKIDAALKKNSSNKYYFGRDFNILRDENNLIHYHDNKGEILLPEPNLIGDHQLYNISTAIAASRKLFNVKDNNVKNAVVKIKLKGRLEEIKSGKLKNMIGKNRLIIDGGHNLSSAISIAHWIKQQSQEVHLICGMMKDKPHVEFIDNFKEIVKSITLVDIPNSEGSISKEDFKNKLGIKNLFLAKSIEDSIKSKNKFKNNIVLCVGSLYLAGEILNLN